MKHVSTPARQGCAEACIGSNCMNITIEDLIKVLHCAVTAD